MNGPFAFPSFNLFYLHRNMQRSPMMAIVTTQATAITIMTKSGNSEKIIKFTLNHLCIEQSSRSPCLEASILGKLRPKFRGSVLVSAGQFGSGFAGAHFSPFSPSATTTALPSKPATHTPTPPQPPK